jgi:hypothetical protein
LEKKHEQYAKLYYKLLAELPIEYQALTGLYQGKPNSLFDPINPKAFEDFEDPYDIAEAPFYYKNFIIYFDEIQAEERL